MKSFGVTIFLISSWIALSAQASEKDLYKFLWLDVDKKVYVLQNKVYQKKKTHYLDIGLIQNVGSSYWDSQGFQFLYGYYFSEEWALELSYHMYQGSESEDSVNLKEINKTVPFVRRIHSKMGGMVLWSPFYGKINTFNRIFYFDWSFGIGGGIIGGEDNAKTVSFRRKADILESTSNVATMTKTTLRFYISKKLHLGLAYHYDLYQAGNVYEEENIDPGSSLTTVSEFIFNIGFSF